MHSACRAQTRNCAYNPRMAEGWRWSIGTAAETEAEKCYTLLRGSNLPWIARSKRRCTHCPGEVAEWLKAADLKSADRFGGPGVRIPPSPLFSANFITIVSL